MTAKQFLNQYSQLKRERALLELKRQEIKRNIFPKAASLKEKVMTSEQISLQELLQEKAEELEKKQLQITEVMADKMDEIASAIDKITDINYKELLTRRYLFNEDWENIANNMNYTTRHIHRMHSRALYILAVQEGLEIKRCQ